MDFTTVNWLAIIVASIINMGLGMLWYGPFFGRPWSAMTGVTRDGMGPDGQKKMYQSMALAFVLAIISNFVFAHVIAVGALATGVAGVAAGISTGIIIWLGFILVATSGVYLWEGKPLKLWAIYSGYYLVLLLINGALLGGWM